MPGEEESNKGSGNYRFEEESNKGSGNYRLS